MLTRIVAGSQDFRTFFTYDPANRLTLLEEQSDEGPRPLKEFFYARSNDGTDKRAGKLVLAKRINWVDAVPPLPEGTGNNPAVVSQAYRYEGLGGRISERQTRMNLGIAHHVFQTGYGYDLLGNINRIDYPSCDDYPCSSSVPDRQVDFTYTNGLLTEVESLATQLSYQLGGMLHTVDHANGVTETLTAPSNRFQRPHSISTSGVGGDNWDTGTYAYDGVGNIKAIDGDFFKYDRMSRLLQGAISVGGASKVQKMTYDVVGNITRLETDGSVFNTLTNPATNHLSGNGASYDAGGNVTEITLGGIDYDYTYDGLNRMKHLQSTSGEARVFLYDADDERIFNIRCAFGSCPGENGLWTATRPRPRQPGLAHARARRRQYLGVETRSCRYHC